MSDFVRQERYDNLDLDLECEGGGGVAVSNCLTAGSYLEANWALASIYVIPLWQRTLKYLVEHLTKSQPFFFFFSFFLIYIKNRLTIDIYNSFGEFSVGQ